MKLLKGKMYLLVGLGNPEPEYSKTRHNMGFDVINKISNKYDIDISRMKYDSIYGSGVIENKKVILLKPQTFMNVIGQAIKKFMRFYKIPIENILVIYDDMDIEIGNIKVRKQGGSGNHNGVKSVVYELLSENFSRIRIGTGKPVEKYNKINYVLEKLNDSEYIKLEKGINKAVEATIEYFKNGIDSVMNKFN